MLSIIVPVPEENPLRVVQETEKSKNVWDKLDERYNGETVIEKLTVLQNLLNRKHIKNRSMGYHIAMLESYYELLSAM